MAIPQDKYRRIVDPSVAVVRLPRGQQSEVNILLLYYFILDVSHQILFVCA